MTALDIINKLNKDVWNHSDRMFGDAFDSIFDSWSKAQSFILGWFRSPHNNNLPQANLLLN
jgi:hypothetical protein